jgi:transposase-like protein
MHVITDSWVMAAMVCSEPRRQNGQVAIQPDKRQLAVQLSQEKKVAVKQICELMGISKPTLYTYVRQAQEARQIG